MRYLPLVLTFALTIYSLVDCAGTGNGEIRNLPKWAWILLIILVAPIGSIGYWIAGRPRRRGSNGGSKRRVLPPDDDPDFLRRL